MTATMFALASICFSCEWMGSAFMNDRTDTPTTGEIRLKLFGRTDVGQIREHNEDNFLIADLTSKSRGLKEEDRERVVQSHGNLFGVCDGMGGAAAGEVASQMAVDLIYQALAEVEPPRDNNELAQNLVSAVEQAGLKIYNEARADRSRRGMGTTSTIAAMFNQRLLLAQVGDSRGYILRGDQFVQVTRDQSLVNQLIEAGQLTEEEAETFEHNNIILQALGTSETVQVDLTYVDLRAGDTLVLCSDGLSGMIKDAEIKEVLLGTSSPMEACRELTERANAAGGHDNITVLVVEFDGPGLKPPDGSDELAYKKYDLPAPEGLTATTRVGPASHSRGPVPAAPPSEEAAKETRELRVSHTMIGAMSPAPTETKSRGTSDAERDDLQQIPTTGLPPVVVGAIVVMSLLIIAGVGVFFLH
jgi:PPM family protein phosphatase